MSLRVNDEDVEIVKFLKAKLGLSTAAVFRVAIRKLRDEESRSEKK